MNVQTNFALSPGDTAIVVLHGGLAGGPIQGYGYFDLITLDHVSGIGSIDGQSQIEIFPNPFSHQATIKSDVPFQGTSLTVLDVFGHEVKRLENISGSSVTLDRRHLQSGAYFIRLMQGNNISATRKLVIVD